MCGRYDLHASEEDVLSTFEVKTCAKFYPRYNIAPGTDIPVLRFSPEGERLVHLLRWGLVPHWSKDPNIGTKLINARAETIAEKPSFRDAYARRRCLVPANGYYEWKTEGKQKLPYYICLKTQKLMALGGVWESWKGPDGNILRTVCLITTTPNRDVSFIHDRMPVLIEEQHWTEWLTGDKDKVTPLLHPAPDESLLFWRVETRVNKTIQDDAGMIVPLSTV